LSNPQKHQLTKAQAEPTLDICPN